MPAALAWVPYPTKASSFLTCSGFKTKCLAYESYRKWIGFPRKNQHGNVRHPSYNNMPVCQAQSDRWQASNIYFLSTAEGWEVETPGVWLLCILRSLLHQLFCLFCELGCKLLRVLVLLGLWLESLSTVMKLRTNMFVGEALESSIEMLLSVCCLGNSACFPVTLPPQPEAWNLFHLRHLPWLQALLPPCTNPCTTSVKGWGCHTFVHDPWKEMGGAAYPSTTKSHFSWVPL